MSNIYFICQGLFYGIENVRHEALENLERVALNCPHLWAEEYLWG